MPSERAWILVLASAAVLGRGTGSFVDRPVGAEQLGQARDGQVAVALTVDAHRPSGRATRDVVPLRLSGTGLYRADGSIDPSNRPFGPQYPLWTDGATKRRWVRLPPGASIDARDADAWRFPAGTTFWKEFSWHGRKVETRMIRIRADGTAAYATYAWNEQGTDAVLVPEGGMARSYEIAPGTWHAIPSATDCGGCHEGGPSRALGFTALQLSDDRDPLAPHAEPITAEFVTLRTLVEEDRLRPIRPEMVRRPPRIRARNDVERAALGYMSTNCGSCHNMSGPLARLGFSLRHDFAENPELPEPAISTAVGQSGRFVVPGDTSGSRLVEPGFPDASAVVHRMTSRRAASQMPPLGTVIADSAGIDLVRRWIMSLPRRTR